MTASGDTTARVWDVATGRDCTSWPATRMRSSRRPSARTASWWSRPVVTPPPGCGTTATGKELHTLAGHTGEVHSAVFSPDGKLVVTASVDSTAKVWDVATGEELHTLAGHTGGHLGGLQSGRHPGGDGQ